MRAHRRALILGGSTEAAELARALAPSRDYDITVSYAGRTRERTSTPGDIRVGGFGGIDGLARYLVATDVDVVVDATHPFAAHMPHHAVEACAAVGVARLRLCRDPWQPVGGDVWHEVPDLDAAAQYLAALGPRRVFLTTGRQELAPFGRVRDSWFLVRTIEAPASMPLPHAKVVLARGPFGEPAERALMIEHDIDVLVAKNSGGTATVAKLEAARALGIPVVMIQRPAAPLGPRAATVDDALVWLRQLPVAPAQADHEPSAG